MAILVLPSAMAIMAIWPFLAVMAHLPSYSDLKDIFGNVMAVGTKWEGGHYLVLTLRYLRIALLPCDEHHVNVPRQDAPPHPASVLPSSCSMFTSAPLRWLE